MNEHLEFEEIVEFLNSTGNSQSDLALAEKVNQHLMKCESCYQMYNALLEFENLSHFLNNDDNLQMRKVLISLKNKLPADKKTSINKIFKNIQKGFNEIVMQIGDGIDLMSSSNSFNFVHPLAIGSRGNSGSNKETDKYRLIDDENTYNRIYYKNGLLMFELDREKYKDMPVVLIVGGNDYLDICPTQEENGKIVAKFNNLREGQYTIYVD